MTKSVTRRGLLGLAAGAGAVAVFAGLRVDGGTSTAVAAERQTFSSGAFEAARSAGKPILVDISATWCPTCRRQKQILDELAAMPKYENLVIFNVDFDAQRDVVRAFGAQRQSTLIAFKGTSEVGRSVADTRADSIEAMLDRTI